MRVQFDHVDVEIGGRLVVGDMNLTVEAGQFVGIVGPNGSGKSTTLRCLYRALKPSDGRIMVGERDIRAISMRENARQVAALTQDNTLHFDFTAREVVATGRLPHSGIVARDRAAEDEAIGEAMDKADAGDLRSRLFSSLSGGEKQRVLIARALAQEPQVLVLDEPTNHLDVQHQHGVLGAAKGLGITVIAALHDLNLAAQYCDRVLVLVDGAVVCAGTPHEVFTETVINRWFSIGCHVVAHPRLGVPQIIFDGPFRAVSDGLNGPVSDGHKPVPNCTPHALHHEES